MKKMSEKIPGRWLSGIVFVILFTFCSGYAIADMTAAKRWIDSEFQPSTLTKAQQEKEM